MKRMKKLPLLLAAGMLCVLCTSCATTAASNAERYFNNVNTIMGNLFSSGKVPAGSGSSEAPAAADPLPTPTDFVMGEDGTYSFAGVEGADYYLLYFCAPDTADGDSSFLYSSEPIPSDHGAGTYAGSYLDILQAAYGEYLARIVAFPAIGDNSRSMSAPVAAPFTAVGEQSTPRLEYFWDPFSGTMNFQLSNVGAYTYQAYPEKIEVTCANVNNPADTVNAVLEGVEPSNVNFSTQLTKGETYTITAHAVSGSEYVTNPTSGESVVGEEVALGELNLLSAAYSYSHGSVNFPLLTEGFDLIHGGSAGDLAGWIGSYSYDCTPVEASPGSAYTYDVSIYYVDQGQGTLELREDGTATLSHTQWAFVRAAHIDGVWIDNGDGTATLNFNTGSVAAD